MSLKYSDQMTAAGSLTVPATPVAQVIKLGWKPRYVKAVNINDLASYEYIEGMTAATALKGTNSASTQFSVVSSNGITVNSDGFTIGTGIADTAADVVRWVAFR